ncbi:AraC family transcriptional regulator [Flavobacterium sp. WW92]|uniref:helix-turn-helix domain-containing protein n=1 Tax=unclassified Flavobacterium TaxID=196869 RepID=UPI0022249881|nr:MULTISPECIES: AraC family transcriptional regulator [unclassified Flavobacterium]WDO12338.1 AraC family transcriptional regulator [Flavobacterium sp. WW92]
MQYQPKFTIHKLRNDSGEIHSVPSPASQILVILVREGKVELRADGLQYTIDSGYFMAVPVSTEYAFRTAGNIRGTAILASHVGFPASRLAWLARLRGISVRLDHGKALMANLMRSAVLCQEERLCSEGLIPGLLDLIFGLAVENYLANNDLRHFHGSLLIQGFLGLVYRNIRREHSVGFYASALHVTPSHLNRTSKSGTGLSAKGCLDCFLVHEARQLLADPAYNITEISDLLHFSHPAVFQRFFRRLTGTTPLCYRAQLGR